ncbi:MAG: sodium/solute symporter [Xanthomonadales bacterium]|nr:sodium/solute symporter [Xanthomonadales bacterium]
MNGFSLDEVDYVAFALFFIILSVIGFRAGRGERNSSNDYFLAGNKLPWYVVGGSLVASVVSTEHFVGMVGWALIFGVSIGMWTWALVTDITLLIFLWVPFLLASRVFTIPQYLEKRFDKRFRLIFALITILLNVFNFMAAVLYTGGLALESLFGWPISVSVVTIGLLSGIWAIYGGLSSVAWTDLFTVVIILVGGSLVVVVGLHALSTESLIDGFKVMLEANQATSGLWHEAVAKHQNIITSAEHYNRLSVFQPNDHIAAPTLGMFLSSFSIGIWYNVMNQFVIQRVLGAKDAYHARLGIVFSGILYIFIPFLIIVPGLILFALHPEILLQDWGDTQKAADRSYIEMIHELMPIGLRGLLLAALFGTIQSTINSVLNSTATIYTLDLYRERINRQATDLDLVRVGIWTSCVTLVIAIGLGILINSLNMSIFYYMQSLNAFFASPFAAVFLLGALWKRANSKGAMMALVFGFAFAIFLKVAPPLFDDFPRWATPILNQAGLILVVSLIAGIVGSLFGLAPDTEKVTDALTFRLNSPYVRSGFGSKFFTGVLFWWLFYLITTGIVFTYFSPLFFK